MEATLKKFVFADIALFLILFAIGFAGEPFLPLSMKSYLDGAPEVPWRLPENVLLAIDIPLLILMILAWLALLRRWRSGRILYTFAFCLGVFADILSGPEIGSVVTQLASIASWVVGGVILGLVYFSDLRHHYVTPREA